MNKILFLIGPTASGKTEVAIRLAHKIGAEAISCDSMQVYRGMDILSQKPTPRQRARVLHHMIGILSPNKEFSVADYRKRAVVAIKKIHKKGKIPLIVGGSGLYVKALIDGLFPSNPKSEKLRARLLRLSHKYGNQYLYNRLKKVDPGAAGSIHPNNTRRVIRALEIYEVSGTPISQMRTKTEGLLSRYDITVFGFMRQRQILYERINRRVDKMFKAGLVNEVKKLKKGKIGQTASFALGYKEITGYLDGKYTEEEAKRLLMRNTRHFAKRQMTWFRKDARIKWIHIGKDEKAGETANKILKYLAVFEKG